MRLANRGAGPTIFCGITPRIPLISSNIRQDKPPMSFRPCRARGTRRSLSFNNDGPIGSFFRYICDNGTYQAYYDDLADGKKNPIDLSKVDVSMDGIELEDREFFAAIKDKREPNSSLQQVLPCMRVLGQVEKLIDPK